MVVMGNREMMRGRNRERGDVVLYFSPLMLDSSIKRDLILHPRHALDRTNVHANCEEDHKLGQTVKEPV